jgi:mono/diheme cytochrome c family protein
MTKTIITPEENNIVLAIPDAYVGKKLEVLMYAIEELAESKSVQNKMSAFKGTLTNEEADQLQEYVKQSREEWNSNI